MDKIKVAIVEDDVGWLSAMTSFLNKEDDISIVGTATNREGAIKLAREIAIDIIIMDINLSENLCDGISASVEILQLVNVKIIMLTSLEEEDVVIDSFTAGAVNFISKENYLDLPNAIRTAYSNKSSYELLLKHFVKIKEGEQLRKLSGSEKEVYELLEQGYSKSQIGKILFKTENTIKTQVKCILDKIGTNSVKEAIWKVKTRGLLGKR